ncbi:YjjG family noncanonical pyrimidine nucleotidase [Bacteroidales bacterium OttesenSCG-928-M11]|nr:YjjG family noncanonical pyrimidine nucleotidase [Bacteroidales bacterium OttesenSCG-928-M11]
MYRTIFIDLDDTIWDTYSNGKESMRETFFDFHFDRFFESFDIFFNIYYPNNCMLWEKYRHGEITKEELTIQRIYYPLSPYIKYDETFILSVNKNFLDRTKLKTKLLPYAIETLSYLQAKYKLYIISNGFKEVQYQKMEHSGLMPYFEGIILSDEVGYNKPHPKIFEAALNFALNSKKEVIMLGDSWDADIVGAKNIGIDQIWYDLGIEKITPEFTPTHRITSLKEIKNIL